MRVAIAFVIVIVGISACSGAGTPPRPDPRPPGNTVVDAALAPTSSWEVPAGWRGETIPFPLDFAPSLAHRGVEELRFPPGFFDPASPEYWSYVFVWRLEDEALLHGVAMGTELTTYFRGLIAAVDGDGAITARDQIVARGVDVAHIADDRGDIRLELNAHVFDAFKTKQPLDLEGSARRTSCPGGGALWVFVLTPNDAMRGELARVGAGASCDVR